MAKLPRVLIIYMACIHESDAHGLLIRNLFSEWPKDNLAQVYSGGDGHGKTFCGRTFKLGPSERRLGRIFFHVKHSSFGESSKPTYLDDASNASSLQKVKKTEIIRNTFSKSLLDTGLWELIFSPRISKHLAEWVRDFSPDVIYCQGYNLSFSWLPIMLNSHFSTPIVFHPADDWPNYLYDKSFIMRRVVSRVVNKLIRRSSARVAFCDKMAIGYSSQFGLPFDSVIMHSDDFKRFDEAETKRNVEKDKISIVYVGTLGAGRWRSLADLCDTASNLAHEGMNIVVSSFSPSLPKEAVNILKSKNNLQILPAIKHDEVPQVLKGADILFLPETFDSKVATWIRYSISTKAHLYMMSRRPILVYGSPIAGIVDYATQEKWAYVVDKRDPELLTDALRQLVTKKDVRLSLVENASRVASQNHDAREVQGRFHDIMKRAADDADNI